MLNFPDSRMGAVSGFRRQRTENSSQWSVVSGRSDETTRLLSGFPKDGVRGRGR